MKTGVLRISAARGLVNLIAPAMNSKQLEAAKIMAVLLMIVDHLAFLLPDHLQTPTHFFGRAAYPLFAFVLTYNYFNNTSNKFHYMMRLIAIGFLAQGPSYTSQFISGGAQYFLFINIMFSLALGVLMFMWLDWLQKNTEEERVQIRWLVAFGGFILIFTASIFVEYSIFSTMMLASYWVWLNKPSSESRNAAIFFTLLLNYPDGLLMMAGGGIVFLLIALIPTFEFKPIKRINRWAYYLFYPLLLISVNIIKVVR